MHTFSRLSSITKRDIEGVRGKRGSFDDDDTFWSQRSSHKRKSDLGHLDETASVSCEQVDEFQEGFEDGCAHICGMWMPMFAGTRQVGMDTLSVYHTQINIA